MAIIITPGYVTSLVGKDNYPHIAYQTWVRDRVGSDITVSSETGNGPKDAILRPDTHEFWQADTLPATLRIDLGQARNVDYVGIAGHTIGTAVRNFLSLPGESGDFGSSPDASPLDILGDIDLRFEGSADDWSPSDFEIFVSKWDTVGNQRAYLFDINSSNFLRIVISTNGTDVVSMVSTVTLPFVNATRHFIRATLDVNDGSGNRVAKFYTSDDGVNWIQLGATVTTAGVVTIFNSTADINIGSITDGTSDFFNGKVYRVQVLDGIDGLIVFDADFSAQEAGTLSFIESSSNAATVTINQSGSPQAEIIKPVAVQILIEHSPDDSAFTTFAAAIAPVNDAPLLFLDTNISRRYWRITLTGLDEVPKISVIYIGEVLVVQRQIYSGHSPAVLSRDTTLFQNMSDGGEFLGQYVRRQGVTGKLNLRHLHAAWYRDNFDTFVKAAREFPFFVAWRPVDFPLEVVYAWTDSNIQPSNMGIRDLMQVSFDFRGIGYAD